MEQHPVPQNVTTFQFRLIGDMTIKQFGYLAGGIILGYICYKLPLPFFFTWPLALFCGLGGFGLAFVPIEERPMDIWVLSFFRNVYSPTLFIWQKQKPTPEATQTIPVAPVKTAPAPVAQKPETPSYPMVTQKTPEGFQTQLKQAQAVAASHANVGVHTPIVTHQHQVAPHHKNILGDLFSFGRLHQEAVTLPGRATQTQGNSGVVTSVSFNPFEWITHKLGLTKAPRVNVASTPFSDSLANVSIAGVRPTLTNQASPQQDEAAPVLAAQPNTQVTAEYEQKIEALQKELTEKTVSDARVIELQKQLTDVLTQKSVMEQRFNELQKKFTQQGAQPARPVQMATPMSPTPTHQTSVRVVTADLAPKVGLPRLTTFPNVVTGIVKDHEGNLLPGVLVTARDKEDIPLRALKTNKLGQFAASTPLPNGTYVIEVEDPRNRYTFDRAQMTLAGGIVPAIEIVAKSQKLIDREKLAREIFGNQT